MSPMLDIQRRHAEVFRLRLGDKSEKGFPQKLTNAIRVTSPNQAVVAAFADVYGGEVRPWEAQWEAYMPTMALPVMVLPGQSITQWWESYKKTVCERRCDGETEQLSGQPCMCPPDITTRMSTAGACRPITRINVACPEVAVVGAGSLVTHGMIAAETLPQSVAIAEAALSRGLMVPAILRVIVHEGKRHYVVPQLEIVGVSIASLDSGEAPALETPAPPALSAAPPAPPAQRAIPARSSASTAPRRPDTPPPLPVELADDFDRISIANTVEKLDEEHRAMFAARWKESGLPPMQHPDFTKAHVEQALTMLQTVEEQAKATYDRRRKHVNAKLNEVGIKTDDARHEAIRHATDGRIDSSKRLTQADVDAIVDLCESLAAGDEAAAS